MAAEPGAPAVLDVRSALAQARALGVARLDAQWLLGHLLQRPRSWLLAHDESPLPPQVAAVWPSLLHRRAGGEPLAYVVGEREFCGMALEVTPAVLVPRPETEGLVGWALERLAEAPSPHVVDLGTGSGAVALALARSAPQAHVTATDLSPDALAVARGNARRLGLPLALAQGSWWAAVPGRRFGLAVSNPPYIAEGDPHLSALVHEPALALTSGRQGLDALFTLIDGAAAHLLPGAWLLLEHGHDQAESLRARMTERGFEAVETRADLAGQPRLTGARWTGIRSQTR